MLSGQRDRYGADHHHREAGALQEFAKARAVEVDYRPTDRLKKDVWDEYRARTDILARLGKLKK